MSVSLIWPPFATICLLIVAHTKSWKYLEITQIHHFYSFLVKRNKKPPSCIIFFKKCLRNILLFFFGPLLNFYDSVNQKTASDNGIRYVVALLVYCWFLVLYDIQNFMKQEQALLTYNHCYMLQMY